MTCILRALIAALCLLLPVTAFGQGAVLQSGPPAPGHVPQYVGSGSQAVVMDGGTSAGGRAGTNPSEFALTARGTGTPPYAGQGKGPLGTNWCDYDAPIDNASGYHYLCLGPNPGQLVFGAGGLASPIPFTFNVNGTAFSLPATGGGGTFVTVAVPTTSGGVVCFLGATGQVTACNGVPNSQLAPVGSATLKGNPTATAGVVPTDFTIAGLPARGAPDANNDKLLIFDNAAGTFKYVTPGLVASSATAGVSSLCGLTGSVTAAQATACLNQFTSSLQGLVPASGGGTANFLRADGTFAPPTPGGTNGQIQFNNAGAFAGVSQVPIGKGGTGLDNTGAATSDTLAYNGSGFIHTAITTLINTACTLSPGLCVALFGYGDPVWWGGDPTGIGASDTAINTALAVSPTVILKGGAWRIGAAIKLQPGSRLSCRAGAVITQGNAANIIVFVDWFTNVATGAQIDHCIVDGNRSNNNDNANVIALDVSTTPDAIIVWNTVRNIPGSAIGVNGGARPTIENNSISNTFALSIGLSGTIANTALYAKVHFNTITGPFSNAIYVYQNDQYDITNNIINSGVAIGGRGSAMQVTISGTTATSVSGTNFSAASAGQFIVVNGGAEFQIAHVVSPTQLTLASSGSLTNVAAAIGGGDGISLNNVSFGKACGNTIIGGVTGGVVLSNESASTENAIGNLICSNVVFDPGNYCYVIDGNNAFGSTVVNNTSLLGNICIAPGQSGAAGASVSGIQLFASSGRVNGVIVDGNQLLDPFTQAGGFWLTAAGAANAVNVQFGFNLAVGFANNNAMSGYPTFASLPVAAVGNSAYIIDGNAAFCGDSTCTTFGTVVTAGGGALKLHLFNNGANYTLSGK